MKRMTLLKNRYEIFIGILILIYISYSILNIEKPWDAGHKGFIGGEKSQIAMNYIKSSYMKTYFAQEVNVNDAITEKDKIYQVYSHHPPGMPFLVSFSFLVFGISEWSARLVPIILNLISIILLYLLVNTYWSKKVAVLSCFFLVFSPMFFFMRNFVAVETLSITFMIGFLYAYVKFLREKNDKKYFYGMFAIFIIGTLSDWVFYFILLPVLAHYFFFHKDKTKMWEIALLPVAAILSFLLFIGQVFVLTGSLEGSSSPITGSMLNTLLFRMNLNTDSLAYGITFFGILEHLYRGINLFYTPVVFYLILIFTAIVAFRALKRKNIEKDILPILILFFMTLFLIIFSNSFWIHDFLIMSLVVPLVICSALAVSILHNTIRSYKNIYLVPIAILVILLAMSLPQFKNIYDSESDIFPIVTFLSENPGNVIVSFGMHPQGYQQRFYFDTRHTGYARTQTDLFNLIHNGNVSYKYFMMRNEESVQEDFLKYLKINYNGYEIEKYWDSYTAFRIN